MRDFATNLRTLSGSAIAGRWDKRALEERLSRALSGGPPDPRRLAARIMLRFDEGVPPPLDQLAAFLGGERTLAETWGRPGAKVEQHIVLDSPVMGPSPSTFAIRPIPTLETTRDLCRWLGLSPGELAWFADCEGRQGQLVNPRLHHYRYKWVAKRSAEHRLLEIPKSRLKLIQRTILRDILDAVPVHPCAHGFVRHRSCRTYAQPHVGKAAVLRMDLRHFFTHVPPPRIGAALMRLGYPLEVARVLRGLCTHSSSPARAGPLFRTLPWALQQRLRAKHLPQGPPTSPALANLCAWNLDRRLAGLAKRFGLDYSRYADDLAFSGSRRLARIANHIQALVGAISAEEGFSINHRKTRLNTRGQTQRLAGITVNEKINVSRTDFDLLKATLFNCLRHGPASQNRENHPNFRDHLAGRVAHVVSLNPRKGARLRVILDRIDWA